MIDKFKLFGSLIFFAVVAVAFAAAIVGVAMQGNAAQEAAEEWSKHLTGVTHVTCVDYDTDGDGYVSCSVFRGDKEPVLVECTGFINNGCRAPKPRIWP